MTAKDFRKMILEKLSVFLKPNRFKKIRTTFQYTNGDLTYFISLQSSDSSTMDTLKITVNIEILSLLLSKLEDTSIPEKDRRHFMKRIGFYLDRPNDKWWFVHSENEADVSAEEIKQIISKRVLPEFDKLETTNDLVEMWRQNISPGLTEKQRNEYISLLNSNK